MARARSQRLVGSRVKDVAELVRGMVGLQTQNVAAARLSVRPRTDGIDAANVTHAYNEKRTVVRTWAMRGTLHMVAAEDVGWIVALLGPIFAAAGRRRRLQLGLDDQVCRRALPLLHRILEAEGPLTRADLIRRLAAKGVSLDPKSQAPPHLIGYAAMQGIICRGPDVEKDEPTYVLVEDWAGAQLELGSEESLAELARRYVTSHGPVRPEDFARWSGLHAGQAENGFKLIAGDLEEAWAGGEPAWVVASRASGSRDSRRPSVRLIGHFDEYLLGYRDRDLVLSSKFAKRIQAGGGFVQPAVLVEGYVAGTWRQIWKKGRLVIEVQPFEPLPDETLPALEAEAADIGRFLSTETEVQVTEPG
jgi:winged helix DNA-binding protein